MIKLERPDCPNSAALRNNYKHAQNKEALRISANDKCMYCESKITHIDFAQVEHIKPKSEEKYPELEFEWTNLGYCCPKCNNNKSDNYDVITPYIDPYSEEPENHITAFGNILFPKNGCERGEITIRDIGLNRSELIERRLERINEITRAINSCFRTNSISLRNAALEELKVEADKDKEYSLVIKKLLKIHEILD